MRMVPVVFKWKDVDLCAEGGEVIRSRVMVPHPRYEKVARRQFAEGEEYPLIVLEARSRASHNQYFAAVNEAWDNLAEDIATRWPTAEHLRKWALVEVGFFDEKVFPDCKSPAHAKQLAVFVRSVDTYAQIHVHKTTVIVREPKSQSAAAMGKDQFEKSKRAVLDLLATLARTTRAQLNENAGASS